MCKSCQYCFESCYWHLIEKRFCFDESIALYEEPAAKYDEEKNNNQFDNIAFYDSVSVIAGRAIVTIDPLDVKKKPEEIQIVTKQPTWQENILKNSEKSSATGLSKSVPAINEEKELVTEDESDASQQSIHKPFSTSNIPEDPSLKLPPKSDTSKSTGVLLQPNPEIRKKSLQERRMSKSLYLRLDLPNKEVPIIRQHSVPKFFLETPEENQSTLVNNLPSALVSPVTTSSEFSYDLYSIVQMAKSKQQEEQNKTPPVPIHHANRLIQIKDRIRLKKSKSTLSASNIPHSNYM